MSEMTLYIPFQIIDLGSYTELFIVLTNLSWPLFLLLLSLIIYTSNKVQIIETLLKQGYNMVQ